MATPDSARISSEFLEFFGRHLVAICVTYRDAVGNRAGHELRFAAYNGTLINIKGVICFLTAGHVLAELKARLKDDRIEILETVLADTFGSGRITDQPIPFDLKNVRSHFIDDDDEGLDFGVIVLDPYFVRLLTINGVVALGEENWINQSKVQFDGYVILGLPQEFTSGCVSISGQATVSPTMFRVIRLDSLPEGSKPTRFPRFVGEIDREIPLTSLRGISGGPIFGFRFGDEMRYWIVALQSSWIPKRRVVFGCPLPVLAPLLSEWVGE